MKKKTLIVILLCAALAVFALGATGVVSLVKGNTDNGSIIENDELNSATSSSGDKLVGALITTEILNLGESGRAYAKLMIKNDVDSVTGETFEHLSYVFEDFDGILMYSARFGSGDDAYWGYDGSEEVSDVAVAYNSGDSEGIRLEGYLYPSTSNGWNYYEINPVYQTADGQVYVVNGESVSFSGDAVNGAVFSKELKEESKVSVKRVVTEDFDANSTNAESVISEGVDKDYVETKFESNIKVNIKTMDSPVEITVRQFNTGDELVNEESFAADSIPEKLDTKDETEYIIVETEFKPVDGECYMERELYNRGNEPVSIFGVNDEGFCIKHSLYWSVN